MDELTQAQLERQDLVDNAIRALLVELSGELCWNIEDIGSVRDTVFQVLHARTGVPEMEFYPFLEGN